MTRNFPSLISELREVYTVILLAAILVLVAAHIGKRFQAGASNVEIWGWLFLATFWGLLGVVDISTRVEWVDLTGTGSILVHASIVLFAIVGTIFVLIGTTSLP